jgi:hypothetical protein
MCVSLECVFVVCGLECKCECVKTRAVARGCVMRLSLAPECGHRFIPRNVCELGVWVWEETPSCQGTQCKVTENTGRPDEVP